MKPEDPPGESHSFEPMVMPPEVIEEVIAQLTTPTPGGPSSDLLGRRGAGIYADLIWNLVSLKYPPAEAESHWQAVLELRRQLSDRVGRDVGVRVAALDYFINIRRELVMARVIDPETLDKLYREATIDPLTNLGNRRLYRERLEQELQRSIRYRTPFVIGIFDVDDFKRVNDRFGHARGDVVLKRVADAVRASIRKADIAARWGGEEFMVLMPETNKRGGSALAERLRARVEHDLADESVTISGGIAAFPIDGEDEKTLFSFADRALYRAKSEGKNCVRVAPFERRAFPRLDQHLKVNLLTLDDGTKVVDQTTTNVGLGGIALRHGEPLWISTKVRGELQWRGKPASFIGRIVYVEEMNVGIYEVGIEFIEIDPAPRDILLAHSQ